MLRFAQPLEQSSIAFVSLPVVTSAPAALQHRLEIVQHQETAMLTQRLKKERDLLVYLIWQVGLPIM
ncbi:MAG TPA: hypothetical protein VIZ18_18505, partial [Ktedonobacteraceae bacterium]